MNCAVLMGPLRGGTTIVSRVIGGHRRVNSVIEPYHARRTEPYEVTDISTFVADAGGVTADGSLFVKETFTRHENVDLSVALLRSAAAAGVRPLAFLLLRSPVEAYLSRIDKSPEWSPGGGFEYGEDTVLILTRSLLRGLHRFVTQTERYHRRVILYSRFVDQPHAETRRVMAAFPYDMEPGQLALAGATKNRGGDRTAWASKEISAKTVTDRRSQVMKFFADFQQSKPARSLMTLHGAIRQWTEDAACQDDFMWTEIERLARQELARNQIAVWK